MRQVFYWLATLGMLAALTAVAQNSYRQSRADMISEVDTMVRETSGYTAIDELTPEIRDAMDSVPRHEFVPESLQERAYLNRPLPIGEGQTISQPYIVALMTQLAGVDEDSVVLEVGTGSGYQAAILAELVAHVYTIEIIPELGKQAAATLDRLGYDNITTRIGDGYGGWSEHAPFDAILVTAAPESIPEPLVEQLKPGGRLVIPVGPRHQVQSLRVLEKDRQGGVRSRDVLPVGFVPLTRDRD